MRVILATYGTRGDVEPMAALALQLQVLGADVRVCAPPDEEFVALLARAGVPLTPFGKPWRAWSAAPSNAEERIVSVDEHVAAYIAATYDTVAAAAEECDLLVASGMLHFIAGSAAETAGIPHRFALFCPSLLAPQPWQPLVAAPINIHRVSIGLPPVDDVRAFLFTGRPWVAADPILVGRQPTPLDIVPAGAWVLPDERPLPADLAAFLEAGAPPVYVGFGSMRVPQDSARVAIEAIRAQGRRIVVARGGADLGLIDDRDDCLAVGEVNQQALFGRVAAVIHHGGAGTTTTAARAGAPQLIVPQAVDQPHWAGRVTELGVGAAHHGPTPTVASLSAALRTALMPDTRARAAAVAGMIRTDGATEAARRLLDVAKQGRASRPL